MAYPAPSEAFASSNPQKVYGFLPPSVLAALNAAHSPNTARAYAADLKKFVSWGGTLPSTPEQVASFMAEMVVERGYKTSSVVRALYAISHWHRAQHQFNPVSDELVKQARRGIVKLHGEPPKRAAALELSNLDRVLAAIGTTDLIDLRDRALLSLGFFGAFRRSELVSLTMDQLAFVEQGVEITLTRSKANKYGAREVKPIVYAQRTELCPIRNLQKWMAAAGIGDGYLFPSLPQNSDIAAHISTHGFYGIVKRRTVAAGLDASEISPHSLRAGFITTAYKAGKDRYRIKQVSGHKSDTVLDSYIRESDRFFDCAGKLA